jgi:hypothetical protein
MTSKDEIILDYGKWIFDRLNNNINIIRDRFFVLGSITLTLLSITSGLLVIYISLGRTNTLSFFLFSFSVLLLIIGLLICFSNFFFIKYKDLSFEKQTVDGYRKLSDTELIEKLISNISSVYESSLKFYEPEKKRKSVKLWFVIALVLNFVSILFLIFIGLVEFIN